MFAGSRAASRALSADFICHRCITRLSTFNLRSKGKAFSSSNGGAERLVSVPLPQLASQREYFSFNASMQETGGGAPALLFARAKQSLQASSNSTGAARSVDQRPHSNTFYDDDQSGKVPRLSRQRIERGKTVAPAATTDYPIPLDASSRLTTISSTLPATSFRRLFALYLSLAKPRLSFLIVLTAAATYTIYPVPAVLLPSTTISPSLSALTLLFLTTGTMLCCASANALNMLFEPKSDAKMNRTKNRPIVRGLIRTRGALVFAGVTASLGVGGLLFGVNHTAAFLGVLNIVLYAGVYTPMKRISVVNTWVGALVGGIPPLMGWAAAAGQSATGSGNWQELLLGENNIGGWLLAGLLFAWQFPHFNALSWNIREEYKNAGLRMLCWTNTKMNGRVAFRYALLLFPICFGLTYYGVTDQGFLITSSVVNAWMVREAWKFWRKEGHKGTARGLFWASVWHLPVVMVLAMVQKKGLWDGIWRRINGEPEEDLWVDEDEEADGRTLISTPISAAPRDHTAR